MVNRALFLATNYIGSSMQLSGCVNDAMDWLDFFATKLPAHLRFPTGSMRILLNKNCNAANMRKHLQWVTDDCGPNDTRIVTFSGHGTQTEQFNGDELDGKTEVICPDDFGWHDNSLFITDNELNKYMHRIHPHAKGLAIFDCCHSGGNTRQIASANTAVKHISPPFDIAFNIKQAEAIKPKPVILRKPDVNWAVLTGCKEQETSLDVTLNGRANGALTTIAIREVWLDILEAPLTTIAARIADKCAQYGFNQTPQAEGLLANKSLVELLS